MLQQRNRVSDILSALEAGLFEMRQWLVTKAYWRCALTPRETRFSPEGEACFFFLSTELEHKSNNGNNWQKVSWLSTPKRSIKRGQSYSVQKKGQLNLYHCPPPRCPRSCPFVGHPDILRPIYSRQPSVTHRAAGFIASSWEVKEKAPNSKAVPSSAAITDFGVLQEPGAPHGWYNGVTPCWHRGSASAAEESLHSAACSTPSELSATQTLSHHCREH